jgi:hypothetical protein
VNGKDLLLTRRFWGVILTAFGPLLTRYLGIAPGDVTIDALVMLSGVTLAIWGHQKRKKKITSVAGMKLKRKK